MDFSNYKFRCSSLGDLMTSPRAKSEKLSETAKTKILECFITEKYNREKEVFSKYMEKGILVEDESITLLSRVKKKLYFKNEDRITNEFISGTPDLFEGETINNATHIIDIKSSWDIHTYLAAKTKPLNKDYYYQLQGYMALTGAGKSTLAYCLVNTPETLINDAKQKLFYRMDGVTTENVEYKKACEELETSMKFDDIPMRERVFEIEISRNESVIEDIYKKVEEAREYFATLEDVTDKYWIKHFEKELV